MATKPKVGQIAATKPRFEYVDVDRSQLTGARFYDDSPVVAETEAPEAPGMLRRIGDTAVQFGQGVVTGGKMMSDIFGANNAVSSGLSDVNQALDGLLSATAQGDKQKVAQIMQEAEGKGWGEQIVAGLKAAGVDPVGLAANALGTSLPTMATMLIPGAGPAAVAARMGAGVAMGAGQGVGAVKGQIYDETKRKWLEARATPEQAEAKAQEAAAYGGANTDQIAIGGVLGMGSVLGAERALGKVLHGASKAGPGMLGRVATSTLAETGTEMLQGGQEKFATNTALNRQGFDVDPMSGVIANATLEGAAAAPMGAVAGIPKPAVAAAPGIDPAKEAADTIRAIEKVPESGTLAKALNAGVEAKAQAVEAGAPLLDEQAAADQMADTAPEPVDDPVRDQILALPDGARQDALRAYAVVNRDDVAKGVLQYNRKLLDRLLAENAPPPVLGDRLTDTDMGAMLGGGGMAGNADPLMGALGMNREAQANSISNVARAAENRPPMPASDAARMLDEARNQGVDLAVTEHPAGGFVLVPPNWVTPDMAAQGEQRLNETIARMQQADAAPVERAPRTSTAPVDLSLPTDPVQNYVGNLRTVNTPAAQAFVRDFDAGRITPADVRQRMQAEQGVTPDQRLQRAASEAPAQADPVAERLRQAVSQSATSAPTDILNPSGLPFKTMMSARLAAKRAPGAEVVPVEGGFVVRPQEPVNVQDVPQAPEVPQAAPAISQPGQAPQAVGAQPAGPAAGVPAEGAGAVEAAGVEGATPSATPIASTMAADGWAGETGSPDDTIWTKQVNGETYTARLTGDSMEVTVPVNGVSTQIGYTTTADPAAAAKVASKAVADDAGLETPAVGAPLDALQNQAVAPVAQAQEAAKGVANQPITRAQVDSAVQQASSAVGARIDAMSAQEVQKIAARFLPTMGVRVPAGKARIKEAVTSAGPRMNWAAAAAEFGAELSQDAMSALQADMEGRVQEGAGPAMPSAVAEISPAPATHADPGQAPEVVTPAVVAQSVQKAARNEDTKPSEMRKWLVGKIDEAIAVAPEAAVDFLSFDVPGDGTFKVQNSQARLQEFRKKVMASPGFKDGGQKQNTNPPEQVDGARNGSGSTVEAVRNFLADGDVQGAVEFAKLKGVEFTPVPPQMKMSADGRGKAKHMPASVKSSVPSVAEGLTQVEAEQINQYLTAENAIAEQNAVQSPQDGNQAYSDGQQLGADDLLAYFDQVIAGSQKGEKIVNPRFQIGEVDAGTAQEIANYIDGYDGQKRRLRVSGRTLKHIHESRPAIAREIVEQLPGMFSKPDEVLPDPKHKNKRALLVKERKAGESQSKPKSYVATVEVEIEVEVRDGFIDIVTIMTAPDRSLREARELKKNWPEGQQRTEQAVNSPHPLTAEAANPEADSPDARPAGVSVPPAAPTAQPDTPKLTPAEATALMAWEDLGQKDGVKTHALTFYESQADKDAKRGRMIVAKVSKGDRSATAWMVDGEDKTFGMLAQAKKLAEEVGMARAVADGYVEQGAAAPKAAKKPAAPATTGAPIEDAGAKIGGARKDRWKERGLNLDDLDAMTEAEGAELATKANVWKPNYEARIDALFAGEKAAGPNQGARVLDRSDVLGLMGLGDGPVNLAEGKVIKGQTNHPRMTAEQWKKVPVWLDNPAAVFDSDTVPGALVLIAPETINGATVRMTVEPRKGGGADVHILSNTYDAPGFTPFARWFREGLGRLVDQKKFPAVLSDSGLQLSSSTWQNKPGMPKILTEKHLDGYRRANTPAAFMGQAATTADSNARNVATQLLVDGLKAKWSRAPEIIVARNMQDTQIPQAVRDYDETLKSQGATGEARGFIYKGKVYLLSDQLKGPQQIAEVLFHEVLGHYGLRGAFGDSLNSILQQMGTMRRKDVVAKAREYGLFNKDALGGLDKAAASDSQIWAAMSNKQRLDAAEEVLAEMAQTKPELGYVKRAIAAIRNWLRANVPGFKSLKLTDADIVQKYLLPARAYVTRSNETAQQAIDRAMTDAGFSRTDDRINFSRTTAQSIASSMGDMTPDQEKAYKNVAGVKAVPTVRERMDALKANLGLKLRQGLVDQFAAIKQLDQNAYVQARMSKGTDGTLEAMLMYGKPFMRDGAPDVDVKDGGFAKVLASLKGEQDRWMMWIAAQRAEKLKAEGKENLMTDDDISALKTLNAGRMADGTARTPVYAKALAELNEYNDAMLKLAMDSGLIDQDAYDLMAGQPYVPFYRLMEDGDMKGPKFSSGLTNQKAWQKLKGGTQQLNADLLQNMLLNWSHLLQASAKNRAATATMDAAEKMAVAYKVAADTKGAVKVMRDGSAEHWMVEDPYLLDAISAIHYVPSPLMKPLAKFKQLLTWGVTVNPTFKIRNLIRDSVSAIAQSELGYNPGANVAKGWKLTAKDSQIYASMLASGGLIKFGTQENTDRLRAQVAKLGGVVLDKSGTERFFGQIKDLYDVYNEFGDRAENVNRAALYDALIKKGKTHAEAAFMARDLMDFSMGGSAPVVRFLTQTVPFLNARLVGLDKLGRAAIEDPRRFAAVSGAVALASLALMAAYSDDEDWKKREDWDRDAYWWFKIGGQAYRIPKPFEVGAIGTLAERTAELMLNDEMTGKRYMERVSHMLSGTFSFNPVPQAFKPLLDLYANKDSFTGRAIESQADQRLRPQDRYSERTPEVAKFLGGLGLPDPAQLVKGEYSALSPKQVEHLIRGYFSWVGTAAMTVSDFGLRPLAGRGERPDMRLKDVFIAGNFVENLPTGSSRYVTQMYEQSRQAEQAYASYQEAIKAGDTEKAQSIKESAGPLLRNRPAYTAATRQLAEINRAAKRIEADQAMAGAAKRARLTQLEQQRHVIAQRVSRLAAATP